MIAEEAEKKKDSVQLKAPLIECSALRKRSQDIMKNVPKQDIEIKEIEEKLKLYLLATYCTRFIKCFNINPYMSSHLGKKSR